MRARVSYRITSSQIYNRTQKLLLLFVCVLSQPAQKPSEKKIKLTKKREEKNVIISFKVNDDDDNNNNNERRHTLNDDDDDEGEKREELKRTNE